MSYDSARLFFNRILEDDAFRAKACECTTGIQLIQYAGRSDYNFTFQEFVSELPKSIDNSAINQHGTPKEQLKWLLASGIYRGI